MIADCFYRETFAALSTGCPMSNNPLPYAPAAIISAGATNFGRFVGAIADPNIEPNGRLGRTRLKEWHYLSFAGDDAFVAIAVVQLGYL